MPILTKQNGRDVPLFPGHDPGHDIDFYKKKADEFMLKFKPDDIKYIIVRDEDDISDVMTRLDELVELQQYTSDEADRLYARILTYRQIQEDF